MSCAPLLQRAEESAGAYDRAVFQDGVLCRLFAGSRDVGMAEALSCGHHFIPIDGRSVKQAQSRFHNLHCNSRRREGVLDYAVETTE